MNQFTKQRTCAIAVYERSAPEALEAVRILRREYTSARGLSTVIVRIINNYLASGACESYNDLLKRRIYATMWAFHLSDSPAQNETYQRFAQMFAPPEDPDHSFTKQTSNIDALAQRFAVDASSFQF